jgi:hypothetical protein
MNRYTFRAELLAADVGNFSRVAFFYWDLVPG